MADDVEELQRQNKLLRDQIARLLTKTVDLERQLEDVTRARAQSGVDALASALARSVRSANATLAAEAGDQPRFAVSDMEATFRGTVLASSSGVAFRLPVPEYGVLPGHLGEVRMTMATVPPPAGTPPAPLPSVAAAAAATPSPEAQLTAALEQAQQMFTGWTAERGKAAASHIVARTTQLLASPQRWNRPRDLAADVKKIADALHSLAKARRAGGFASEVGPYRAVANSLTQHARTIVSDREVTANAIEDLSDALERIATFSLPK